MTKIRTISKTLTTPSFMKKVCLILGCSLLSFSAPLIGEEKPKELKKATLRPQWVPQAQFAGYYVAKAKGFYLEEGIDLEIRPGGPGFHVLNNIAAGEETFGTNTLMGAISMASKGAPLINIGQMHQSDGLMLLSFKKSGIKHPKDMEGKKVGIWPGQFSMLPTLLFKKFNVKPNLVGQEFSMDQLLKNEIDVASAQVYNEYHMVLESGVKESDLNIFRFSDFGLNYIEDAVFARRDTCEKDPKLCKGFIKASLKGWLYSFDHPDEAVSIIMEEANKSKTNTTAAHQKTMLLEVKKLMMAKGKGQMGILDKKDFDFLVNLLIENNQITKDNAVKFETFFMNFAK